MNYELNDYLIKLHQHIINEQSHIRTLIKMVENGAQQEALISKVVSIKDVRNNVEKRLATSPDWLIMGEKDSRFGIFLKLNSQLQKWVETEIGLLKEITKIQAAQTQKSPTNDEIGGELCPEDLNILQNYYKQTIDAN